MGACHLAADAAMRVPVCACAVLGAGSHGRHCVQAEVRNAHDGQIWTLAFHPVGHLLATGGVDGQTRFWCRARPGDAWLDRAPRDLSADVHAELGERPPVGVLAASVRPGRRGWQACMARPHSACWQLLPARPRVGPAAVQEQSRWLASVAQVQLLQMAAARVS